jgi:hypothetical protein
VADYVELWGLGFGISEIARAYGVKPPAVHQALRRRDVITPKRMPGDLDDEAIEVLLDAYTMPWEYTVAGALALAYEDMAERGVRRARA